MLPQITSEQMNEADAVALATLAMHLAYFMVEVQKRGILRFSLAIFALSSVSLAVAVRFHRDYALLTCQRALITAHVTFVEVPGPSRRHGGS